MTRYLGPVLMSVAILATSTMLVAILGRVWDWSPWALVLVGAILGVVEGIGLTVLVYETDVPEPVPCVAQSAWGYVCTEPLGHPGDHIARASGGTVLTVWHRPWERPETIATATTRDDAGNVVDIGSRSGGAHL